MLKSIVCVGLILASMFKVDVTFTGEPLWLLWGNPRDIHYVSTEHVWINNNPANENVFHAMDAYEGTRKHTLPERVPEKSDLKISLNSNLWRREEPTTKLEQGALAGAVIFPKRKRIHLINPEPTFNPEVCNLVQYQVWPHLGMLSVGTVADQEGWEVSLHDELVQGPVQLQHLIEPGDIVGLSLVATGVERGVELAAEAKRLGARYVIAGNDSAIFRADQLLRLPNNPIDGVFTSNSLTAVRGFLREIELVSNIEHLQIPGVAVIPTGVTLSNEADVLKAQRKIQTQLRQQGQFDPHDVFVVPKLNLYSDDYWQTVWRNYRTIFGHKHQRPEKLRNALALFAQGCTRTGTADVCSYCTIAGVADIRMPTKEYLSQLLDTYASFGINYVFNTTDSLLEMRPAARMLKELNAFFEEGLMLYGRAWGLGHHPELIDDWLCLTGGRLLINVGMDSGDERILSRGVHKASLAGSRLKENQQAVRNLAASGAHLHYSLIFGSPGETRETCEASLQFFEWTRSILGAQLDQCETDIYWLNHGSPASRVFRDYEYAQKLAAIADKTISRETWEGRFYRHRDTLTVPWECEHAWYECFTHISVEEAQAYNTHVANVMASHLDAAPGRGNAFRPG